MVRMLVVLMAVAEARGLGPSETDTALPRRLGSVQPMGGLRDEEGPENRVPRVVDVKQAHGPRASPSMAAAPAPEAKRPQAERPSLSLMEAARSLVKAAPEAQQSVEVPKYFSNLPFSVKFVDKGDKWAMTFLDQDVLSFEVSKNVVIFYPLVLVPTYTILWCICCLRSQRSGMSFKLILEASTCFMCLWADLATKYRVVSKSRAWSFVGLFGVLITLWPVCNRVWAAEDAWREEVVFWAFGSGLTLVWCMFAVERMFVRKFFRRSVDPMSSDSYAMDCCLSLCCGQLSAIQEAQMMADSERSSTADAKSKW